MEIIVGLLVIILIDKLFPGIKNEKDPTIFLIDMDMHHSDKSDGSDYYESDVEDIEYYDW